MTNDIAVAAAEALAQHGMGSTTWLEMGQAVADAIEPLIAAREAKAWDEGTAWVRKHPADYAYRANPHRVENEAAGGIVQNPSGQIMGVDHDFVPGGSQDTPLGSTALSTAAPAQEES